MKTEEIKLESPMEALHTFASKLTEKVRELDKLEREYRIMPQQSTEILSQMIEAHLYAVLKALLTSGRILPAEKVTALKALNLLTKPLNPKE